MNLADNDCDTNSTHSNTNKSIHWIVNEFQASKRQPGTSGRLHRTVTGEWVWSEEEDESALDHLTFEDETLREEDDRPMNQLQRADSSSEGEEVRTF